MKKYIIRITGFFFAALLVGCADNSLPVTPMDGDFPLQLILDTDEGGDLADAEDYDIEIKFADYIGSLPSTTVVLSYEISGEGSFEGVVEIDKVVYEVEIGDCTYERELSFDPAAQTITVVSDPDLGTVPEAFEVVVVLPAAADTEGGFSFEITGIQAGSSNIVVGQPSRFEYEVLDNDLAGKWVLEFETEDQFLAFREVFSVIGPELKGLSYSDITGSVVIEFEYGEMKFEIELVDEEEVCEDGEQELVNKTIEIEAEYDAEDGALVLEGSHLIINDDDGEVEDELDFIVESIYEKNSENNILKLIIKRIIDEDNFEEGKELFLDEVTFSFIKD